ncbi:uncharacterized protein LOC129754811 isoform X1 [Uranotaenia lowii]|uniref:uncharacterized protein LOC129754811 isoform X1 n=1 Tax=Uranotaenia lowii TaxID=190385 RepID=UPI002479E057|nr:uncharacterized protein LOC129754811 isoform X1 [Uranotaenia lowii]
MGPTEERRGKKLPKPETERKKKAAPRGVGATPFLNSFDSAAEEQKTGLRCENLPVLLHFSPTEIQCRNGQVHRKPSSGLGVHRAWRKKAGRRFRVHVVVLKAENRFPRRSDFPERSTWCRRSALRPSGSMAVMVARGGLCNSKPNRVAPTSSRRRRNRGVGTPPKFEPNGFGGAKHRE